MAFIALDWGCVTTPKRTIEEEASSQASLRCKPDANEDAIRAVFGRDAVERIEPLYTVAAPGGAGSGGNYSRLIGAIVHLRAIKGISADWLDAALECHSARRVLGQLPQDAPMDPFFLPGRMVDIEAVAGRAGYQVYVRGQNIRDAEAILSRANAFFEASSHP